MIFVVYYAISMMFGAGYSAPFLPNCAEKPLASAMGMKGT